MNSDATNEEEEDEMIEDGSAIRKVGLVRPRHDRLRAIDRDMTVFSA